MQTKQATDAVIFHIIPDITQHISVKSDINMIFWLRKSGSQRLGMTHIKLAIHVSSKLGLPAEGYETNQYERMIFLCT